jgi:hypothetical protein
MSAMLIGHVDLIREPAGVCEKTGLYLPEQERSAAFNTELASCRELTDRLKKAQYWLLGRLQQHRRTCIVLTPSTSACR